MQRRLKPLTGYLVVCALVVTGVATTLVAGESRAKAQHHHLIAGKPHLDLALPPPSCTSPDTVFHAAAELSGVAQRFNAATRRIVKVDPTGNRQHTRAILFTITTSTYL